MTLALGSILTRLFGDESPTGQIEREISTFYLVSNNSLASVSSPMGYLEIILWEENNRLGYDYDILYALWTCESQNRHEGIWGDNYQSYGGFQWQLPSWVMYNRILGTDLNITSLKDQAIMTIMVLKRGDWWNWKNCLYNKFN